MEKKEEIEIGNPVAIAGATLVPITKLSLNYWHGNRGISFFGIKQPFSVIVVSPSEKRAFGITGEEISLDQLIQEVPDIEELLARIQSPSGT